MDGVDKLQMGVGSGPSNEDDFADDCSDEERYNPTMKEKGIWEPEPADIVQLYAALTKGDALHLEWLCPGRRSPEPEPSDSEMADDSGINATEVKQEEKVEPNEFDFDEGPDMPTAITPRRTPGSIKSARPQQKRVARMDKIMNDILRHKRMEANERKSPAGTPQRPLPKLKIRKDVFTKEPTTTPSSTSSS